MKRRLCKILVATILMATTLMLSACSGCARNEEWGGYFTVKFYDDRETAYITGLTEEGQQQRFW